ncbi:MAG: DUF2851 family protein [Planctomycetes bacterium]|nr:DUF2851 family protein [Planctomycetota bacterium]
MSRSSRRLPVSACRGPEDVLVAAWYGLRFAREALRTLEGDDVRVESPGVREAGSGPDFHDARLVIGGREVRGDVELHCDPAEWSRHGHDRDPRYDAVVLHVSLTGGVEVVTSSGRRVPRLVVAPVGAEPSARRRVPAVAAEAGIGPCHEEAPARLVKALEDFGVERMQRRAARFAEWARQDGPDEAVWRALAEVMGYGANYQAFRALALHVPWSSFGDAPPGPGRAIAVEAALLHASGLWPGEPVDAPSRARLLELFATLPPRRVEPFGAAAWRPAVRPPDAPVRRFAALAALVAETSPSGLLDRWAADPDHAAASLLVPPLPYWNLRAAWGPAAFARPVSLLGAGRARVAAASAILPLVTALRPSAADSARRAFLNLGPLPEDHITRFVRFRIFGAPRGRRLSAAAQQGLHHLYRAGCALGKPACPRCPLPSRVRLRRTGRCRGPEDECFSRAHIPRAFPDQPPLQSPFYETDRLPRVLRQIRRFRLPSRQEVPLRPVQRNPHRS